MKQLTLLTLLLAVMSSCSQAKRCQRHYRLSQPCRTTDTLTLRDTIKGFQIDTIVKFTERNTVDTLIVDSGGIKVVTFVRWKERLVTQSINKRDTVIVNKVVRDCPKCPECTHWKWYVWLWIGMGLMALRLIMLKHNY